MQTHYTYIIRNKLTKQVYIGVRSCNGPADDDIKYWGSCATLSEAINSTGICHFQKRILSTFKNRKEAVAHEILLHDRYDVSHSVKFYNVVKQTSTGFDNSGRKYKLKNPMTAEHKDKLSEAAKRRTGNNSSMYGKKHSEKTKQKIRDARAKQIMKPVTDETRQKMSKSLTGMFVGKKVSAETGRKISKAKLGHKTSDSTKAKMSASALGKKWYNNGKTAIRVKPGTQPEGYVLGKKLIV